MYKSLPLLEIVGVLFLFKYGNKHGQVYIDMVQLAQVYTR